MQKHKCWPLVWIGSLADIDEEKAIQAYALVLKQREPRMGCGCCSCDFHEASVLFFQPGALADSLSLLRNKQGTCLSFCGEWFECSLSEQHVSAKAYLPFHFSTREALHVSRKELRVLQACLDDVQHELDWGIDTFSNLLVAERIKLLLDYCLRFYERQFYLRGDNNSQVMKRVRQAVDEYLGSPHRSIGGEQFLTESLARVNEMTPAYLDALVRHETGKPLHLYIKLRRAELLGGEMLI